MKVDLEFLYMLVDLLSQEFQAELTLKGALSLNLLLDYRTTTLNYRLTEDYDTYLVGGREVFSNLCDSVNKALKSLGHDGMYEAVSKRRPKNHSAGRISVQRRDDGDLWFNIDVDIDPAKEVIQVLLPSNREINSVSINSICVDKIESISEDTIRYRIKDIYDIYLIASMFEPNFEPIFVMFQSMFRGDKARERYETGQAFKSFRNDYDVLKEYYDTELTDLSDPSLKPDFEEVYLRAFAFVAPFIVDERKTRDAIWSVDSMDWIPIFTLPRSISSSDEFAPSENF